MYYITTNHTDTNSWYRTYQVQDWRNQNNCNHARNIARYYAQDRDWEFLDTQHRGNQYMVHFRDNDGHYRTVTIDRDFNVQRSDDRYY